MTWQDVLDRRAYQTRERVAKLAMQEEVVSRFGFDTSDGVDECALAFALFEGVCGDCGHSELTWREDGVEDPQEWAATCQICDKVWNAERLVGGDVVAF